MLSMLSMEQLHLPQNHVNVVTQINFKKVEVLVKIVSYQIFEKMP